MKKIYLFLMAVLVAVSCSQDGDSANESGDGQGGSMAIFALKGNYLYTVDYNDLNVFSLLDPAGPVKVNQVQVGFDIETLFSDGDNLYIGSRTGMYIYSITNPEDPELVGQAHHLTACDPVVSNGTHAFVTLHSNTGCGNNINALMVYDIANPAQPQLINTRNLVAPKGLGLYGNYLVVCDNEILIFDITDAAHPQLAASINKQCHDVIIRDNTLFAIANEAVYRYTLNASNISNITLQSQVAF